MIAGPLTTKLAYAQQADPGSILKLAAGKYTN